MTNRQSLDKPEKHAPMVNMVEIPLSQGMSAVVSDDDYRIVSQFKWCAKKERGTYYAVTNANGHGKRQLYMHRLILGIDDPAMRVDHRDGNGLNNSRANIRAATALQNNRNRKKPSGKTSRYKGVSLEPRRPRSPWRATIRIDGRQKHLGCFASEEDAARAYDSEARSIFGEFASTNFASSA